ncbi:MAG TPA: 3-deoxy-D-manno-octulosonic acid transferase [Terriglobales bacterium]|nr:3-deoxy-D-manno-octulosonic acid transferase [Terriglobales bacterium]
MYFTYTLLYSLIFILLSPYLFLRGLFGRHGILERLGKIRIPEKLSFPLVWFHAASVGEVKALATILPRLKRLRPDCSIAVSVVTKTGKREASATLSQADLISYFPLDFPFIWKKVFRKLNPSLLVLVETEFWPNLIREAKNYGCKLCMINGRISKTSFKRYRKIKSFSSLVLSNIDLFCMQSKEDAEKLWNLGGDKSRTEIVGNLKFDRALLGINGSNKMVLRRRLELSKDDRLIIAGSTHQEEERIVLTVFKRLREEQPNLVLLLAPRHLSRLNEIQELLLEMKLDYVKRSTFHKDKRAEIILLDTMGELENLYSISEIAFVGGSLVPTGGHNILEPASYGVPVLFGPYIDNFKPSSDLLLKFGGGIMVKDQEELYQRMSELLKDETLRKKIGEKGKQALLSQTGTSEKTVQLLLKHLSGNENK